MHPANHATRAIALLGLDNFLLNYKLDAKRDGGLVSLKYDQINSPMGEPEVADCRGLIVEEDDPTRIVAMTYRKFWNAGESRADKIDWSTARVYEKLDGSLMQLYWWRGAWRVASSGHPTAGGPYGASDRLFRDVFWETWAELGYRLPPRPADDRGNTYAFELCRPDNRIVVRYPKPRLVLHGARRMSNLAELDEDALAAECAWFGWELAKSYPIGSAAEAAEAALALDPLANEGFVVVDAQFNRVKIKSPRYVAVHHLRGVRSARAIVELWQTGEMSEIIAHYPELAPDFDRVVGGIEAAQQQVLGAWRQFGGEVDRKSFALAVKELPFAGVLFKLFGTSPLDPEGAIGKAIRGMQPSAVLRAIGAADLDHIDTTDRAEIEARLDALLAPYEETPPADSPYRVFEDEEDAYRKEYETEGVEMVKIEPGTVLNARFAAASMRGVPESGPFSSAVKVDDAYYVYSHDDAFRVEGTFGFSGGGSHKVPEDAIKVEVPHRKHWPTFESFMADWHGNEARDEKHGRYGHYRNPNAKWDWWIIGGRWTGFYPVAGLPIGGLARRRGESGAFGNLPTIGKVDIVRVSEIDFKAVAAEHQERFDNFVAEYTQLLAGRKFPTFEGPRDTALRLGLVDVVRGPHEAVGDEIALPWSVVYPNCNDDRASWTDVMLPLTDERLRAIRSHFNPLRTFAALDDAGWHEAGEMGWFGCDDGTADKRLAFADAFEEKFIKACGPDDLLVLVDYHI